MVSIIVTVVTCPAPQQRTQEFRVWIPSRTCKEDVRDRHLHR